jgi:hypothetical protein
MPAADDPAMLITVNDDIAILRSAVAELVPAFQTRAGEAE